jgi:hypothetical protein
MADKHVNCTHICGRKTTQKHMHSRTDNVTMGLKETEWEGTDWVNLAPDKNQGRTLVTAVMNLQVPFIAGFFFYENKTNQCIRNYTNLLHYNRRRFPTCFGHLLWPSSGRCFSKGILQVTR